MSITNDFFVYYQGEEDYFLKIKTTYTKYSNLFQLFGSFLNEFVTTFNLKNKNTANTQFYYIDTITDKKTLVTNFSLSIPESKYEYLIRPKEITDDSYPNTLTDSCLIDSMIEKGQDFESRKFYFTAYSFYLAAGEKAIPNLVKMFYELNDFQSITKYLDDISTQYDKDPYLNEILGYTYEWMNDKSKAIETFWLFKDKEPIQSVAYNRLLFSSGSIKARNQPKVSIEKEILSCMKPGEVIFDTQSIADNSFFCKPPRSEKIYTYEVIKTFTERSLFKEAIEFCIKNARFFKLNLPILANKSELALNFVSAISNETLTFSIAREVCACFINQNQSDAAIKLATFLYNQNKVEINSISLLMHIYYSTAKFDKIATVASEMIENFDPKARYYDIRLDSLLMRMMKIPAFNQNFDSDNEINSKRYGMERHGISINTQELDLVQNCNRYSFVIYIVFYLLVNHNLREVNDIMPLYFKSIKWGMEFRKKDELTEIFNILSQVNSNIVTSLYFSPENKKFFVFGDFSVLIFANVVFKVTEKAINGESDAFVECPSSKNGKNKSKNIINLNDFQDFWSYQAMMNQDENGTLVQAECLVIPEFSLWRLREGKKRKFVSASFDSRLKDIKDALNKSKSIDDPVVFMFGKRDITKHIPNLILKRKFKSFEELKNEYSSLFLDAIRKIRSFLPKAKIIIQLDYSNYSNSNYSTLFYEAISQNVPDNVEIILPLEKYKRTFLSQNVSLTNEKIIDVVNSYLYQQFIDKSKKLYNK